MDRHSPGAVGLFFVELSSKAGRGRYQPLRALLRSERPGSDQAPCGGSEVKIRTAGGASGLSSVHISPRPSENPAGCVAIWHEGSKIKVMKPLRDRTRLRQGEPIPRGKIKQFSWDSRRRLMRKLAETVRGRHPLFITLTYPGTFPTDPEKWKRDFDTIWKRLERRFPQACGIWKLEAQRRGAPHFHLLVWNIDYKKTVFWIKQAWYEVVGSCDERHLRAGTRVEAIRSWNGVMMYAAKYMGKIETCQGWESPGRFWGVRNKEFIPMSDIKVIPITYKQACELMRYLRRYCHIKGRDYQSLTGLVDGRVWAHRIDQLIT